jgi:Domain of unknown function (DUF5063)
MRLEAEGDPVAAFRPVAERYVSAVEMAGERSQEDLFAALVRVLLELYVAALELPKPAGEPAGLPEERVTHEQWKEVFDRLQAALGASDVYWTVPCWDGEEDASLGTLADDLADIYRDVKEGLELAASGASEEVVLDQWRDSFWMHWGEHAVEALRVIHARLKRYGGEWLDLPPRRI